MSLSDKMSSSWSRSTSKDPYPSSVGKEGRGEVSGKYVELEEVRGEGKKVMELC